MQPKESYITAGELASLYAIPKQTLLYYDKNSLLVPAFINENGYRFYSVSQYLILEIILNMRKLNIPIREIKNYLSNRDSDYLEQILRDKKKECDTVIEDMINIKNSLHFSLDAIENVKKIRLDQIELVFQEEKILLISEILTDDTPVKDRIKIFSRHNQSAFSKKHFKEFTTGWILDQHDFFAEKFNKTLQYFTPVSRVVTKKHCLTRPEGLYLTICSEGTYYQIASAICRKIKKLIELNQLTPIGNVYVFPLKNHWLTEDTSTYINQISLQVKYPQNQDEQSK